MASVWQWIFGRPLASDEQEESHIGVLSGLPALGLDGLSSAAYGPEAALTMLLPLGAAGLWYIQPISLAILILLGMLYASYRQTIEAYPAGGGSYTVAKENLGQRWGLLAASALLIDYILNVAVGISAGAAALVSAVPALQPYTLALCLGVLVFITVANLRGTRDAGTAFALPTYLFITCLSALICWGIARAAMAGGHPQPLEKLPDLPAATEAVGLWILLRSFASGCTAMTGVEAVSNGVTAFKDPQVPNAQRTLTAIVAILALLLGGIAYLAHAYQLVALDQSQAGYQSLLSQLALAVAGRGWFYYVTIGSILVVLCLSANTSFVDFPRLCRLLAEDDCLPRSFAVSGRRLVYTVGVVFLSVAAGLLLVAFDGITDRLIPLFAVGAFTAFTLSQTGMVAHWRKQLSHPSGATTNGSRRPAAEPRGRSGVLARMAVNGFGAIATAVSLTIILIAKFVAGAWITVLAIPALFTLFVVIHRYYTRLAKRLQCRGALHLESSQPPVVLLPMRAWDKAAEKALLFALWLSHDVVAVHLKNIDGEDGDDEAARIQKQWDENVVKPLAERGRAAPRLVIAEPRFRSFVQPLLSAVDTLKSEFKDRPIVVVVPEVVGAHWWQALLHMHRATILRVALRDHGDDQVAVLSVPWFTHE